MELYQTISDCGAFIYRNCLRPTVKWLSEYIITLYYTNQLVAYTLAIIARANNIRAKPLVIAIVVPSLSVVLLGLLVALKNSTPPPGTWGYRCKTGLRNTLLYIYSSKIAITLISILSSTCLVMSFDVLLLYYCATASIHIQVNGLILLGAVVVATALKLSELIAHFPLIHHIQYELNKAAQTEDTEPKSTPDAPTAQQEKIRINLLCFNYYVGFTVNSLTVVLGILAAGLTTVSSLTAFSVLATISTLGLLSSALLYYKQHHPSQNENQLKVPESSPSTLPSAELSGNISNTLGAENRPLVDAMLTLISQLNLPI